MELRIFEISKTMHVDIESLKKAKRSVMIRSCVVVLGSQFFFCLNLPKFKKKIEKKKAFFLWLIQDVIFLLA